jgi:flavin-dependent dehydrogenase
MFDRAGLARPVELEKRCDHLPFTLVGQGADARLDAGLRPMWGVDMRRLTTRLRETAVEAGVEPFDRAVLGDIVESQGRLTELGLSARRVSEASAEVRPYTLRARLFVDATGTRQALLRRFLPLAVDCPAPADSEVCTAVQQVRAIVDRDGALAFLARHRVSPGQVLTFTGLRGGYSTLAVLVEPDLDRVDVLTGVGGGANHGRASQLQRELVRAERWIGPVVYGGGGRIPIRRPYDRLAAPGLVLVGDAGCQVFPVHGSGVGSGLVAARILADAVRSFDDPGGEPATWAYQAAFHRERGGVHAAYDLMRRASQRLDGATLDAFLASGLIAEGSTRAALDQRLHVPTAVEALGLARAASRTPRAATGLVWAALRMPLVQQAYRAYPREPDPAALHRWATAVALLCGHAADPGRGS